MYSLFQAIIYKGVEHPQILLSDRVLEQISHRYPGRTELSFVFVCLLVFWVVVHKRYVDF